MATYDVLRLIVELLESLHISSVNGRSDGVNAIFHNVPEIVVNCLKMHVHLVLLVKVGHPAETLIMPTVDITKTPGS